MKMRGGGCIVNASIGGGKAPLAGSLPTSVMRSAGLNLTKSLANEFAADQIRVNAICIGLIKSMQWVRRAGNKNAQELYDDMAKRIPLGRVGEAEEYADLVAFLCSKRATLLRDLQLIWMGACALLSSSRPLKLGLVFCVSFRSYLSFQNDHLRQFFSIGQFTPI